MAEVCHHKFVIKLDMIIILCISAKMAKVSEIFALILSMMHENVENLAAS